MLFAPRLCYEHNKLISPESRQPKLPQGGTGSPVCRRATLFYMTYSEKLKDPRWQKKRLEILQRDLFACRLCEDKETQLQVHHLQYMNEPWDVPNDKLITYCKHCHQVVELFKNWQQKEIPLSVIKLYSKDNNTYYLCVKTSFENLSLFEITNHSAIRMIGFKKETFVRMAKMMGVING